MYIKSIVKSNRKGGKKFYHYRLVEGYRIDGKVRHRTLLNLGSVPLFDEVMNRKVVADRIEELLKGTGELFAPGLEGELEELARYYYERLIEKRVIEQAGVDHEAGKEEEKDFKWVDLNSIHDENVREIGAEWMCKQMINKLEVAGCLQRIGWNNKWVTLALIGIISRAVLAWSEHKTAQWLGINSGLLELYNIPNNKVNRHQLYAVASRLYESKDRLEQFLSRKTDELFDQDNKIILYDLTNTYFEGRKARSKKAKHGVSKEKRSDAKLIVLAVVVNVNGFLKYSQFYEGNMSDSTTLVKTIRHIEKHSHTKDQRKLIVMDAGIATEKNLEMLRQKGYDYLSVSRKKLKDYEVQVSQNIVKLTDKRDNPIEIKILQPTDDQPDRFVYVWSKQKQLKEHGIEQKMIQRYTEQLMCIEKAIHTKGGVKKEEKVWQRLGRLKQKYPRVSKYFDIKVEAQNGIVTVLKWTEQNLELQKHQGVYFLRTTLDSEQEKNLWTIYQTLKEIEYTFRVLKTDLNLRPVFHQKDKYTEAHLFLGLLAYQLVSAIRYELKQQNIQHDWTNIVRIMNTQKIITTFFKGKKANYFIRKCSRPAPQALQIYKALNQSSMPFIVKKSVVPH